MQRQGKDEKNSPRNLTNISYVSHCGIALSNNSFYITEISFSIGVTFFLEIALSTDMDFGFHLSFRLLLLTRSHLNVTTRFLRYYCI
jgi:hypothetical protein